MAEWLVEHGIGETRALLVENDQVLAAKLHWPGELVAGQQVSARLISKLSGSRRGLATLQNGIEVLIDQLPDGVTEGTTLALDITRAPIAEKGRFKRAQGRFVAEPDSAASFSPFAALEATTVHRFPNGLWEDMWSCGSAGSIAFAGGELLVAVTPAMTLIDIDGTGAPRELALAAIPALKRAIQWFDLGGSIGIDFPTITAKADRKLVDAALGEALHDWPHERTATNGFGFVQLVARLDGPSLLHRFATSRAGMCARFAMRLAEQAEGIGPTVLMTVHPALKAKLKPDWIEELAKRTGKQVEIEVDPGLALESPQAQIKAS